MIKDFIYAYGVVCGLLCRVTRWTLQQLLAMMCSSAWLGPATSKDEFPLIYTLTDFCPKLGQGVAKNCRKRHFAGHLVPLCTETLPNWRQVVHRSQRANAIFVWLLSKIKQKFLSKHAPQRRTMPIPIFIRVLFRYADNPPELCSN